MIFLSGYISVLVEPEAGDVGFFDETGVSHGFVEDERVELDAVPGAEMHEEVGELSQFGGEPFCIVGRGDSTEQKYVVGEMGSSAGGC